MERGTLVLAFGGVEKRAWGIEADIIHAKDVA